MLRFVFGAFLVVFGLAIFSDQVAILNLIGLNFDTIMAGFWLILGVALLIKRHTFWGVLFTIIGFVGVLSGLFHISLGSLILPAIFIAIGLNILFKKPESWGPGINTSRGSDSDEIKENIAFAGMDRSYVSQNFKGGKIDVAFGGFKADLREVKLAKEGAVLEINAAFGGGEIIVPRSMRVRSEGTGMIGGWEEKFVSEATKDSPVLVIKGSAVFGGVEIKN